MLKRLISKTLQTPSLQEYALLGRRIEHSPVQVFDYKEFLKVLKKISRENRSFINNKEYALFYKKKLFVCGEKVYKLPENEKLLAFVQKEFEAPVAALLCYKCFDQVLIYYVRKNGLK